MPGGVGRRIKNMFKIGARGDKTADIAEDVIAGGWIKITIDRDRSGCVRNDQETDTTLQTTSSNDLLDLICDECEAIALTTFDGYCFVHMATLPNPLVINSNHEKVN